jgi:hypothetical protein
MEDINNVLENIGTKEVARRSFRYTRELERGNVHCKSNETLPIKSIYQNTQKRGNTKNKMERPTSKKKTKEPPKKKANHKEKHRVLKPPSPLSPCCKKHIK